MKINFDSRMNILERFEYQDYRLIEEMKRIIEEIIV